MKMRTWVFLLAWVGFGMTSSSTYAAARYALEVIQPIAGLDTKNRFYKAYPGLVYNVRPAVIGGSYPFKYELTTAPSGMAIDSFTGEINWESPAASTTPYPVSLKVTDADGSVATVSWTVTVTTNGFRFLDAVNGKRSALFGGTGDGSINNPWATIEDVLEGSDATAKNKTTYRYEFLYFKNGSYARPSDVSEINASKPMVWMAYPGDKPVITGYLLMTGENVYLDGFDYNISGGTSGGQFGANVSHQGGGGAVIRRSVFHNLAFPVPAEDYKLLAYGLRINAPNTVVQDNVFHDFQHGAGLIGYENSVKTLIENNLFYNFSSPNNAHAISIKGGNRMWFIRGNHLHDLDGALGSGINIEYTPNKYLLDDIEISYNLLRNGTYSVFQAGPKEANSGELFVHHNTFVGQLANNSVTTGDGPFYYYNNVIVNDQAGTPTGSHIGQSPDTDPSKIIITDNLTGYPADGVVNGDGDLTSSVHIGKYGHQLSGSRQAVPPARPADPSTYTVTIVKSGSGGGTVTAEGINCDLANTDCTGSYPAFGFIKVTVIPDATSTYDGMLETCDFINPCGFRVNKSQTLTVKLTRVPPTAAEFFPLEILQPREGLGTTNRFYKAYPGLIYNVRAGVIGGNYPYKHELTTAPAGMTIDSFRGEIKWPNPTIANSPHPVTLKVTDRDGRVKTVSWTITVTTTGFRFLDAVNGQPSALFGGTGTGSIDNPWKSLADVYEGETDAAKWEDSYKKEFLYFKSGTYRIPAKEFNSDNKPVVWMAYPGEKPVLEGPVHLGVGGALIVLDQNPYFEGFEFGNMGSYGFRFQGEAGTATLWKNDLHGLMTGSGGCPDPSVRLLQANESVIFLDMSNFTMQDNVVHDIPCGSGIKGYDKSRKVLIENNTFHAFGISGSNGQGGDTIAPKAGIQGWFIRANNIYDATGLGIYFLNVNNDKTRNNEVSYNRVKMLSGPAFSSTAGSFRVGPLYIHHNTFFGPVRAEKLDAFDGPYYFYNNVVVNNLSAKGQEEHISVQHGTAPERIIKTDNISGFPNDGLINHSDLRLQGVYRDQYLGTRGWELDLTLPLPPKNLRIVP